MFEYSCFISYRHNQQEQAKPLVQKLYENLSEEMNHFFVTEKVFLDQNRFQGGDFYQGGACSQSMQKCLHDRSFYSGVL